MGVEIKFEVDKVEDRRWTIGFEMKFKVEGLEN
jgi:hypothetical protein